MHRTRYRATVVYSLDLGRSAGPRVVPLDAVSWWLVRQQMVEAAGAALVFGVLGMGIVKVAQQVLGR